MDGMHRVAKALLQGLGEIEAAGFQVDPDPDYVGGRPSELPYRPARRARGLRTVVIPRTVR